MLFCCILVNRLRRSALITPVEALFELITRRRILRSNRVSVLMCMDCIHISLFLSSHLVSSCIHPFTHVHTLLMAIRHTLMLQHQEQFGVQHVARRHIYRLQGLGIEPRFYDHLTTNEPPEPQHACFLGISLVDSKLETLPGCQ